MGNTVLRLIIINVAIHLLIAIGYVPFYLMQDSTQGGISDLYNSYISDFFYLPSDLMLLAKRPWTILTYMFLHSSLLHLVLNMLVLYWFGQILNSLLPNQKMFPLYLLGGFLGGLLFVGAYNVFPTFTAIAAKPSIVGASAGVMAILIATAVLHPRGQMRILFIGNVELRYIALFVLILDIISIPGNNSGGHFAHIGGAIMGWIYIRSLYKGVDMSKPFNRFFQFIGKSIFREQPSPRPYKREPQHAYKTSQTQATPTPPQAQPVPPPPPTFEQSNPLMAGFGKSFIQQYNNMSKQECVDAILDKIRRSGYTSLTEDEKKFLDKTSREGTL